MMDPTGIPGMPGPGRFSPSATRPIFYPIPQATIGAAAIARAARLCRCVRKSFAGIRWREGQNQMQMTWAEVDAALANHGNN